MSWAVNTPQPVPAVDIEKELRSLFDAQINQQDKAIAAAIAAAVAVAQSVSFEGKLLVRLMGSESGVQISVDWVAPEDPPPLPALSVAKAA